MSPRNTRSLRSANLAAELVSWLQRSTDEMAALAAELVAIPTENPPGMEYGACADFLERRLQELGLPCERIQVSHTSAKDRSASPAILLATHGRGSRTLYFHGHYDVVPAQSPQQFQPARRENFLFGRGASDMKGGVVAMLYAILALKEWGADLNGKICLTLVPDEETGGARGSGWLAQQGLLAPHKQDSSSPRAAAAGMLTAEPTSGVIWNASRGAITLRVEVFGKSAHVGLQHHGENAFERMHRVVARLQNLKHEVEQRKTACTIGADQARDSILMLGGKSGGGANFNVVPEKCWFTADRRINPEEDLETEKARLIDVLQECKRDGIPMEWEILQEGRSAACPEDESLGRVLASSIETITSQTPRFEMCPGLLETRFYAAQGIPAYAYGPGLLSVAHGPNEYVDLRRMAACAAIYALAAVRIFGH